jgi:hypothetical protein
MAIGEERVTRGRTGGANEGSDRLLNEFAVDWPAVKRNREVELFMQRRQFHIRKDRSRPQLAWLIATSGRTCWELLSRIVIIEQREADLFQIVLTMTSPRRLACSLHCGQQQCHEHTDNRNHDEQFNEGKTSCESIGPMMETQLRIPPLRQEHHCKFQVEACHLH